MFYQLQNHLHISSLPRAHKCELEFWKVTEKKGMAEEDNVSGVEIKWAKKEHLKKWKRKENILYSDLDFNFSENDL